MVRGKKPFYIKRRGKVLIGGRVLVNALLWEMVIGQAVYLHLGRIKDEGDRRCGREDLNQGIEIMPQGSAIHQ